MDAKKKTTDDGIDEVHRLYRELADDFRDPLSGHRRANKIVDRIRSLLASVLADPTTLERLAVIAATDPDELVREMAANDADPSPPPSTYDLFVAWLRHPAIGLEALADAVRPALGLKESMAADDAARDAELADQQRYAEHYDSSWFGGAPLGPLPQWPYRDDDIALVHVAQIDLRPLGWARREQPGVWGVGEDLPSTGVLQVFHDLETPGDQPDDGRRNAWLVRYVEEPQEPVTPPSDAAGPTAVPAPAGLTPLMTLPAPEDLDRDLQATVELAQRRILNAARRPDKPEEVDPKPVSHLLGHGWESADEAHAMLTGAAGAEGNAEDWVLLVDLAGVGALDAWFGDEGHLEIWMRHPDIIERRFHRAWALLR